MSSVNKAILIGNLGGDPESKQVGDQTVVNFSIATNESWNDKNGNKQEKVEWHRIVVWGKLAENCVKYLVKGRTVYVEGRIQTRSWDDKDKAGVKHYMTEIVAQQVTFLGSKSDDGESRSSNRDDRKPPKGDEPKRPPGDDEIPF